MVKYLINEEYVVEDAEARKDFGKGEKREDYADAWKNTGNVVLVGLAGAGKAALAEILGVNTGHPVVRPATPEEAVDALSGTGVIIVLDEPLVEAEAVQSLIHGAGKVFYLMADTKLLSERVAERDAVEDFDTLWREQSARLAALEPVFYSVLHFILQASEKPEVMAGEAMEKIGY